jgi:hypothetical protein
MVSDNPLPYYTYYSYTEPMVTRMRLDVKFIGTLPVLHSTVPRGCIPEGWCGRYSALLWKQTKPSLLPSGSQSKGQ